MRLGIHLAVAASFLHCSLAYANGWASGQNFVPVIEETIATDESGEKMVLAAGSPVYVEPEIAELRTWVRWTKRPRERRVQIDRSTLPGNLDGFRAYQAGDFKRSARMMAKEAKSETNALTRSWKLIVAGHSHLLADPKAYDKAARFYRMASQGSENEFQSYAVYFEARALMSQRKYEEGSERLNGLWKRFEEGRLPPNVLFFTYPQASEVTAWGQGVRDLREAKGALDKFIARKKAFESRESAQDDESRAEICYQFALATEELWYIFPDRFFDMPYPREVPSVLEVTFKEYPATEAAAKAYYRWLDYQGVRDWEGDGFGSHAQAKEHMERFLQRYPNSRIADKARRRLDAANAYLKEHGDPAAATEQETGE